MFISEKKQSVSEPRFGVNISKKKIGITYTSYVVLKVLCGEFKKITVTMYILAILFVLKYIFL